MKLRFLTDMQLLLSVQVDIVIETGTYLVGSSGYLQLKQGTYFIWLNHRNRKFCRLMPNCAI